MGHTSKNKEIELPSGDTLEGRVYHTDAEPKGGVIIIPGLGGVINPECETLTKASGDFYDLMGAYLGDRGYDSVLYNHRGHRDSSGTLNMRAFFEDYQYVSEEVMKPYAGNLYAIGFSLGGYISLMGAARQPELYEAVVAIAPPHSLEGHFPEKLEKILDKALKLPPILQDGLLGLTNIVLGTKDKGSLFKYLKKVFTDENKRTAIFRQFGNCRLPNPRLRAYEEWRDVPDEFKSIERYEVETPVLFIHGESEGLVHPLGEIDTYVQVFRDHIVTLEEHMFDEISHGYETADGSCFLETDESIALLIEDFFERASQD